MNLKQELDQKMDLLWNNCLLQTAETFDELNEIACEEGNGLLVNANRWDQWRDGWNFWDKNYEPSMGDVIYFDSTIDDVSYDSPYVYYVVGFEDVCDDPESQPWIR